MSWGEPTVTYLELRESNPDGSASAGLSHTSKGLVLLHVQELAASGEPRGAVTVVHDAGGHGGLYLRLARSLSQDGWSVALPDLRGHGRSEGARGHSNGMREVVRDLGDVQDHLAYRQPEAPKVLIGQGLGALACVAYACERPGGVAALVLAGPLLEPRFELPEKVGGLRRLFQRTTGESAGRIGWDVRARTSDPDGAAELAAPPAHDAVTLRAGEEARTAAYRYWPVLGSLDLPVLVLIGAEDEIAPAKRARALSGPRVEVREFAGLRHDLFHEARASDVTQALVRWLDAQLPR